MLLAYRIDSARRIVVLTAERRPTTAEWIATLEAAAADPDYRPGFDILYDRTCGDPANDTEATRAWAQRYGQLVAALGGRLAIVVSAPGTYGAARMASILAELRGATVEVFWSVSDALIWLGRDPHNDAT